MHPLSVWIWREDVLTLDSPPMEGAVREWDLTLDLAPTLDLVLAAYDLCLSFVQLVESGPESFAQYRAGSVCAYSLLEEDQAPPSEITTSMLCADFGGRTPFDADSTAIRTSRLWVAWGEPSGTLRPELTAVVSPQQILDCERARGELIAGIVVVGQPIGSDAPGYCNQSVDGVTRPGGGVPVALHICCDDPK